MSYSISTLLFRNLHDVFGENDPARAGANLEVISSSLYFKQKKDGKMSDKVANPRKDLMRFQP